jgi:hypothetical protein
MAYERERERALEGFKLLQATHHHQQHASSSRLLLLIS